jgi:transcriptional repressor NrdR
MKCPFCAHLEDKVIDSRAAGTGEVIRRRRECEGCNRRFTTYERVEDVLPTVVKKDGRREPFDRQKLLRGLRTACNKRPVPVERVDATADAIEREVQEIEGREVSASELGERVMAHLRELDEVAYVRFASVYRSFRDADEFLRELGKLVEGRGSSTSEAAPQATGARAAPTESGDEGGTTGASAVVPIRSRVE